MYIFHLLRSFLPSVNPIGFGAADFIEITFALLLALLAVASRTRIEEYGRRLAEKARWSMLLLGVLPIALRLALLARSPVPTATVSDDFSYLLVADTLRHFRLANPPHSLSQFFETYFALQSPTYSSIFPLGPALPILLGWVILGLPWAGVALSVGLMCALSYWMLKAWTTNGWAFIGGLFAVIEFGPLSHWMNSYWGGAVSACAGCLVFGALPRIRENGRVRDAIWLGLGLGLQLLSRPFESLLLDLVVVLFFVPALRDREKLRRLASLAIPAALVVLPALALTLLHHHSATGSWTTMPYMLSRYQYGIPTTFTTQPIPTPHRPLTREQQMDYDTQSTVHGEGTDSWAHYWLRWLDRFRFYRFFFLPPLLLAIPFFLPGLRESRFRFVAFTIVLFSLVTNIYPYFYAHYIAAIACLFLLVGVEGLRRLSQVTLRGSTSGQDAARLILIFCGAHFLFWFGLHAAGDENMMAAMVPYETLDIVNRGDPQGRIAVSNKLVSLPGRQLVFVRYWPQHGLEEWVHNAADIDTSKVVWARDLGAAENEKLLGYYRDRTAWLLEPDARPPRLSPYPRIVSP